MKAKKILFMINPVKCFVILLFIQSFAIGWTTTAQETDGYKILDRIDRNMSSENRIFTSKMIIHGARGSRTMEMKSWATNDNQTFTEYLAPAREAGTKMLKLKDQLWMYSPSTDRIIQISGHMLRQSVMGSDLSYEDMMDDRSLSEIYDVVVTGSETVDGSECYVLELSARVSDVGYQKRKLWVDKEKWVPLKEELYAKGGTLLKRTTMSEIKKVDNRWFPMRMHYKDMLKKGEGTEFIVTDIQFDQKIPDHLFTKAALK